MIRTEFTNRIARQIGVEPTSFKSLVEKRPETIRTLSTEPFEAVELGFEKVVKFIADKTDQHLAGSPNTGLEAAGEALRRENPKAYDTVGEFFLQTSAGVNESVGPHHFVSFGDGVSAVQVTGHSFNGTLWIDTTPGEPGIHSMLLRNDKTHGPNPCIAPPPPREGEVATDGGKVDAKLLSNVSSELGADKVFTGLDDEKLTRFTDWALGKTDLPIGTPLAGLPEGWAELPEGERGHLGKGDNYILGSPFGSHQVLGVDTKSGEITLVTDREYRQPGDFEGSADVLKLTRYPDGEIRRHYHEMHD